jgi:hypothetical protein
VLLDRWFLHRKQSSLRHRPSAEQRAA